MPPEITVDLFRVKVRNQRYAVRVGVWGYGRVVKDRVTATV